MLELLRSPTCRSQQSLHSLEMADDAVFVPHVARRPTCSLTLLGKSTCAVAFRFCTGGHRLGLAKRFATDGKLTWTTAPAWRPAERRSEMSAGIWAVVADLGEHNPFAKCGDDAAQSVSSMQSGESDHRLDKIWRLPFHQKVCLWRLVLALHGKGQVGRSQYGERLSQPYWSCSASLPCCLPPEVFTREPRYQELRRAIASQEFKCVHFHRFHIGVLGPLRVP